MPTYEYRCPDGHTFDLFQRMSDDPVADCPECGKASERLLSAGAGFLFKGDGFYITDYRSDAYKKAASKDAGESGGSGKSDSAAASSSSGSGGSSSDAPSSSSTSKD